MENAVKPAGFWRRAASLLIDLVLSLPILYVCKQLQGDAQQEVVFTVILLVLYTLFLSSPWRATPGMRLTRVEAVGADGKPLSKAHAFYWCIASSLFACLAFAPILYVQWWIKQYGVGPLLQMVSIGKITPETFSIELQVRTGINAQQMTGMFTMCLLVTAILCLIWALSVVLSKRKVGWHNWLSATRFIIRDKA